jgi:hypothetical protein
MNGCAHCGSMKGYDRTYGRCTACGEPYQAGASGDHFRTKKPPPPEFFERFRGLGTIPVEPAITGSWPFQGFPNQVELDGTLFVLATWAWPFYGAAAQYREAVDYDAMHLLVYRDGSFEIGHLDEANPDRGHVLEHAVLDAPLGTAIACGAIGFGAGLVGGLLLWWGES